jgi:carboxypeptidase PM20D1
MRIQSALVIVLLAAGAWSVPGGNGDAAPRLSSDSTWTGVAIVRTVEKGYLTLELIVRGEGGHSSRPPAETPVGILSRAIVRLESNPFPARLDGAALDLIRTVAPDQGAMARTALANRWLLDRTLLRMLAASNSTVPAGTSPRRPAPAPVRS